VWASTGVCVCVPDEGQVNPERAVCPGTVDAEKHPVCDARPAGVLQGAVEAHLDTHTHTYYNSQYIHDTFNYVI